MIGNRIPTFCMALGLAFAPSVAVAQDDLGSVAGWQRVEVQVGVFSVQTPCALENVKRVDRRESPGIQCRIGDRGLGFGALVTRNGLTPGEGDDTFDGIYSELNSSNADGAIEVMEIAGRRAFRAANPYQPSMIVQVVELAESELAILIYVGEPLEEGGQAGNAAQFEKAAEFFDTLEFFE